MRALEDCVENLTPFVALALALIVTPHTGGLGRRSGSWRASFYIPPYLFNVVYVRTATWAVSIIGLLMMLARVIGT